jgi:Ca2+-binding RTX toxin-like protein
MPFHIPPACDSRADLGARSRVLLALCAFVVLAVLLATSPRTEANTSHEGWPPRTGVLLMNKLDQSRPLDARPGQDIFGDRDPSYSCDGLHRNNACARASGVVSREGHNELLGGHGNDDIHAGLQGDVIWGDYKPSGQPTTQVDRLAGGPGNDFIYASHGENIIRAGGGDDVVKAHFGRGQIDCGGGTDVLYISRKAQKAYTIRGCETVSHRTLGY